MNSMNNFIFATVVSLYLEHGTTLSNFQQKYFASIFVLPLNKD